MDESLDTYRFLFNIYCSKSGQYLTLSDLSHEKLLVHQSLKTNKVGQIGRVLRGLLNPITRLQTKLTPMLYMERYSYFDRMQSAIETLGMEHEEFNERRVKLLKLVQFKCLELPKQQSKYC